MEKSPAKIKNFFSQKRNIAALAVWGALFAALVGGVIMCIVQYGAGAINFADFKHRLFYSFLCLVMMSAVYIAELILRVRFSLSLEIALSVFAFAALAMGTVFAVYKLIPAWDKVLHTLSGVLFSAAGLGVALAFLKNQPTGTRKVLAVIFIGFLVSLAVGYIWEIYEYTVDSLFPSYDCQRWKDAIIESFPDGTYLVNDRRGSAIVDTMGDMIVNLIGTVAFLVPMTVLFIKQPQRMELFAFRSLRKKKQPVLEEPTDNATNE